MLPAFMLDKPFAERRFHARECRALSCRALNAACAWGREAYRYTHTIYLHHPDAITRAHLNLMTAALEDRRARALGFHLPG